HRLAPLTLPASGPTAAIACVTHPAVSGTLFFQSFPGWSVPATAFITCADGRRLLFPGTITSSVVDSVSLRHMRPSAVTFPKYEFNHQHKCPLNQPTFLY